jgi:peptide/nickel transport system ATP-binding protein/oligopeptide transport system ATP-binding protein
MTSLTPHLKVGIQLAEVLVNHSHMSWREAEKAALRALERVRVPEAQRRLRQYPHELSGGMRQRVMIGMSLLCEPKLLIADEPTTALDVTVQAQIMDILRIMRAESRMAIVLISHDLGLVAGLADRIVVMYAGRVVERAPTRELFYDPQMPYTWGLLGSIPRLDRPKPERLHSIEGAPPSLIQLPQGCKFRPRCPHAFDKCMQEPGLENRVETPGHLDRCWLDVDKKRSLREATIRGDRPEAA